MPNQRDVLTHPSPSFADEEVLATSCQACGREYRELYRYWLSDAHLARPHLCAACREQDGVQPVSRERRQTSVSEEDAKISIAVAAFLAGVLFTIVCGVVMGLTLG